MGTLERKREQKERKRERERKPRKKRQHISKSQSGSRWRARVLCLLKKRGRRRQKKISFDGIITGEYLYDFAESTGADEGTKRQRDDHHRLPDFAVSCGLFADGPRSAKKKKLCQVCVTDKTPYYGQSCAPTCPRKIPKFDLKLGLRIPNDSLTKLYRNIAHSGSSLLV